LLFSYFVSYFVSLHIDLFILWYKILIWAHNRCLLYWIRQLHLAHRKLFILTIDRHVWPLFFGLELTFIKFTLRWRFSPLLLIVLSWWAFFYFWIFFKQCLRRIYNVWIRTHFLNFRFDFSGNLLGSMHWNSI